VHLKWKPARDELGRIEQEAFRVTNDDGGKADTFQFIHFFVEMNAK